MKSMILAAGFGTRLRPITYFLPKPLVPVANKPLIAYAVENYLRAGVEEIAVNLHHLPQLIEQYLTSAFDCAFHFSREETILGTGGALRRVRHLFEDQEDFFLVNGDTIQSPPFEELLRARREHDAPAALTLRHPPPHDKFTPVFFESGRITGFGSGSGEALMFSGAHAIGAAIFDRLPNKESFSIVDDVYRGAPLAGVVDDGPWFDIGTPQRYLEASGGTTVGARCTIDGTLNGSVVWDDCRIGAGVVLNECIVAHGVELDGPTEITRAIICLDHPSIPAEYRREGGLVISPF
jgi:NDP-sugar pyrophosphorylase family protein